MAREPNKQDKQPGNSPETRPLVEGQPVIVDTAAADPNAQPDPRGENRPGVIPDLPLQEGVDPVTNRYSVEVDPSTGMVSDTAASLPPLNPPEGSQPKPAAQQKAPSGPLMEMQFSRDYWPRHRPEGHPADQEYRVRAGETAKLPRSEAEDLMEQGIATRTKRG